MAWLPALTAVTPRPSASTVRFSITVRAPRGLKVPVRWNSSSLSTTRVPRGNARARSSQARTGVVTTRSPSLSRVARIASRVGRSLTSVDEAVAQEGLHVDELRPVLGAHRELPRLAAQRAVQVHARVAAAAIQHVEAHVEVR